MRMLLFAYTAESYPTEKRRRWGGYLIEESKRERGEASLNEEEEGREGRGTLGPLGEKTRTEKVHMFFLFSHLECLKSLEKTRVQK